MEPAGIPFPLGSESLRPRVLGRVERALLSKWLTVKALGSASDLLLPGLAMNTQVLKNHAHIWRKHLTADKSAGERAG